jgi:hypothetical protein
MLYYVNSWFRKSAKNRTKKIEYRSFYHSSCASLLRTLTINSFVYPLLDTSIYHICAPFFFCDAEFYTGLNLIFEISLIGKNEIRILRKVKADKRRKKNLKFIFIFGTSLLILPCPLCLVPRPLCLYPSLALPPSLALLLLVPLVPKITCPHRHPCQKHQPHLHHLP